MIDLVLSFLSLQLVFVETESNVSLSGVDGQNHPFLNKAKGLIVIADVLVAEVLDGVFNVVEGLVLLDGVFFGVLESVVCHFLDQLFVPEVLSLLPEKLLRVLFTNGLSVSFKQVEEALDEVLELNYFSFWQIEHSLFI